MKFETGTRVLVTGGAGFVGSHLCESLLERGCLVDVIDDLSTGSRDNIRHLEPDPRFSFTRESIAQEDVLDDLVRRADVVYHLAAVVGVELILDDPVRVLEGNIFGTRAVLRAADQHRKKILLTSTSEVYGKRENVPFHEDDDCLVGPTTKGRWSYATSKAVNEHLGLAYHRRNGLPVVIFRLFNTVGPRQSSRYGMVIPRLVRQALAGEPLTVFGDGTQKRCFCDVADVVRGMTELGGHPGAVGQVINVGSDTEISIGDLARRILWRIDPKADPEVRIEHIPYDRAYAPGFEDMKRRRPSLERIRSLIDWTPRIPLEETLDRVIASCRQISPISV